MLILPGYQILTLLERETTHANLYALLLLCGNSIRSKEYKIIFYKVFDIIFDIIFG